MGLWVTKYRPSIMGHHIEGQIHEQILLNLSNYILMILVTLFRQHAPYPGP